MLQDRQFDARNQLVFRGDNMMEMMNGFLGDRILVSGTPNSQAYPEADAGIVGMMGMGMGMGRGMGMRGMG